MSFFWKRRQVPDNGEKEERFDVDQAIATISARLRFLEILTADLVAELPPTKRDRLLQHLDERVGSLTTLTPPASVPTDKNLVFRDELRGALGVLIQNSKPRGKAPIKR